MKHYHIAFVGLGSIGQRHFNNVCQLLTSRGCSFSIDLYRNDLAKRLPKEITERVDRQYLYSEQLKKELGYDAVFVTNPTSLHYAAIAKFKNHAAAFFIEKPLFDSIYVDESLLKDIKHIPTYVACPLRYHPVLQYIEQHVDYKSAIAVRAISSSYLPDWRPGQDYRKCYSAHRDMGGGVAIDLIHEWDYLTHFFGIPKVVFSLQERFSSLDIDSDDVAIYIAKTEKTTIELHLDYFGRETLRSLDLFMADDTIQCDIAGGKITWMKEGRILKFNSDRNHYQMKEIEHFFDIVDGKIENDSDVRHAYRVLKLTKGIL